MLNKKVINGSLVIIGTSVGAGMLGLPVETGRGGFFPAIVLLLINWAIMTGSALLITEFLVHYKKNSNFITLSEEILGKTFKFLTFFIYIMLFISLTFAYVKGGGVFVADIIPHLSVGLGVLIFIVMLVPFIVFGPRLFTYANTPLTILLFVSFGGLVFLGFNQINVSLLTHMNWKHGFLSFPIYITSFGFQGTLPSLYSYIENKKDMMKSILIGTTITFLIYLIWQFLVMGIVPLEGENSLMSALQADQTAISVLKYYIDNQFLQLFGMAFYFFAIATSFLGVGIGLIDFLMDAFKIQRKLINRIFVGIIVYLPALYVGQMNLQVFYFSLKYGGGFACFYLFILLPILFYSRRKQTYRF